jgi:hypothetical protein
MAAEIEEARGRRERRRKIIGSRTQVSAQAHDECFSIAVADVVWFLFRLSAWSFLLRSGACLADL